MKSIRSLLIVDDNEGDVFLCKTLFEAVAPGAFPYILTASDGQEALELFTNYEKSRVSDPTRFPPVVVLLDINMPRMDGFEFLEEFAKIRQSFVDITSIILMVTSSNDERDRKRAEGYDFVHSFITKPPSSENILELVEYFGVDD